MNKTRDSKYLGAQLVNEDGRQVEYTYANALGAAHSFSVKLAANTRYFLRVYSSNSNSSIDVNERVVEFAFVVRDASVKTTGGLWGDPNAAPDAQNAPGMNQDEPAMIPVGEKISGTAKDKQTYFYAFKTGNSTEYTISAINKTLGTKFLGIVLYNEYGSQVEYSYPGSRGLAGSFTQNLSPHTVYYLMLYSNDSNVAIDISEMSVDYVFSVRDTTDKSVGALWGEGNAASPDAAAVPGNNQDEPAMIPLGEKITGTAKDGLTFFYSFRTGNGTDYTLSAVNKTLGTKFLGFVLYTESGRQVEYRYVDSHGTVSSFSRSLSPNTTYYLRLYSNSTYTNVDINDQTLDYAFIVRDASAPTEAVWGEGAAAVPDVKNVPGTNQDEPAMIPFDEEINATASDALCSYYAFRTDEAGEYTISAINKTKDSHNLAVYLLNEFGGGIEDVFAENDGMAVSMTQNLAADTVYYLRVSSNSSHYFDINDQVVDYQLLVKGGKADPGEHADLPEEPEQQKPEDPEEHEIDNPIEFSVGTGEGTQDHSPVGYTVGDLIALGFATEEDVTAAVRSREVCDVFIMTKDGIEYEVRAVNPYADEIPLNDCIVCYFGFDDRTGTVTVDGDLCCGKAERGEVESRFVNPLAVKDEYLVYQTQNPEREYDNAYGEFVISEDVQTIDVLFIFEESGTLDQVIFLAPYLLYNSLADNLEDIDVGEADPFALEEAEEARDDILEQLLAAFEAEDIEVAIDEETGRITLDDGILFDFNSYELSDDGKAYIDRVLRAMAAALLDGEHADAVQKVEIGGHTDTNGSHEYNQTLSESRANTVLDYCNGENGAGLTEEQAEAFKSLAAAVGYSFDYPILDSDGKVDMDASRRVEIRFFLTIEE